MVNGAIKRNKDSQVKNLPYKVTDEELPNDFDNYVKSKIKQMSKKMIHTGSPKALRILLDLHEKYPHIPNVINNIAVCYQAQKKYDKVDEFVEKMNKFFPDYLFGRFARAHEAIDECRFKDVPAIFDNCFDLKSLYPERDVFQVAEVVEFSFIMGIYFASIGDIKMLQMHRDIIEELKGENDERAQQLSEAFEAIVGLLKNL